MKGLEAVPRCNQAPWCGDPARWSLMMPAVSRQAADHRFHSILIRQSSFKHPHFFLRLACISLGWHGGMSVSCLSTQYIQNCSCVLIHPASESESCWGQEGKSKQEWPGGQHHPQLAIYILPATTRSSVGCRQHSFLPLRRPRWSHHLNLCVAGAKKATSHKSGQVVSAILSFLTAAAQHQQTALMLVEHSILDFTTALADWLLSPQGAGKPPVWYHSACLCDPAMKGSNQIKDIRPLDPSAHSNDFQQQGCAMRHGQMVLPFDFKAKAAVTQGT